MQPADADLAYMHSLRGWGSSLKLKHCGLLEEMRPQRAAYAAQARQAAVETMTVSLTIPGRRRALSKRALLQSLDYAATKIGLKSPCHPSTSWTCPLNGMRPTEG